VYPAPAVTALITEQFVPVRVHVKENPRAWHRFGIRWTPTVMVLSPEGNEVRRTEGFLPEDELLGQLRLMLGYEAVNRKDWKTAERWFGEAADAPGAERTDAGPEGLYWQGVARFSASHAHDVLPELRRNLERRYPNTSWAKRSIVWGG
jgi:hypothetical protein